MTNGRVAGLLLAAGLSSRMGTPKPLLKWRGLPLVRYQVAQLVAAGCDPVIVVTGYLRERVEAALAGSGATIVYNPDYAAGRAGSLRVGASALPRDVHAIVILNVDQPRDEAVVRRLIDEARSHGALLTVPSFEGQRGHPLVVDGALRDELLRVTEQDAGLKAVVRRHEARRIEVPFDSADVLLDLNTRQAYAAATRASAPAGHQAPLSGDGRE